MNIQPEDEKRKKKGGDGNGLNGYWIFGVILMGILAFQFFSMNTHQNEISEEQFFRSVLPTHDVAQVIIVNDKIAEIYIKPDSVKTKEVYKEFRESKFGTDNKGPQFVVPIITIESFKNKFDQAQANLNSEQLVPLKSETKKGLIDVIGWFFPFILLVALWMYLMRKATSGMSGMGGQIFNIGKSKANLIDNKDTNVSITFEDVAGLDGAKEEVHEVVDFLKNPQKYTSLGAKIPKGVLLVGPPGTGKTLLAKAVAGEAKVPFFSLSGSDFVEMFVGVGASRVRDLFRQAREKAPCIIFIDEIDAVGRARGKNMMQSNDERENTLNQLLVEMDGFSGDKNIILMAATNRPDVLDSALLRPGRFDRQIYVDLPEVKEREAIFKVHLKPLVLANDVQVEFLAKQTPGFSGADIANICNEAALVAARKNKKAVEKQDFLDAIDRVVGGLEKKNKIIKISEKKRIAYHEAGHASVSWLTEHAAPLIKVTIVPRGQSLGAAWYLPEERTITTKEQILDEMCAALGGRASEDVVFGNISTGALSDLEKVTKQAQAMVKVFGLSDKIGNISYYDSSGQSDYSFQKPYSEKTAELIDKEISDIIENQYIRAKQILSENRDKLDKLAELLLEKEVIFKDDLEVIFGKRPFEDEHHQPIIKEDVLPAPTPIETSVSPAAEE